MSTKIAVASANPVKVNAAKEAFEVMLNTEVKVVSVDVASGVPDQPMHSEETRLGAENRVDNAIKAIEADYYIAYEGGVDVFEDGPKTFAILCISNGEDKVFGQTATLPIPIGIYNQLLKGIELGTAMDALFNTHNIKQKGGAIGQLTNEAETRKSIYASATKLALSRFVNAHLF
ncbi:inosine/xanthosine triphosphatase [Glaciecola petra]|uniref:Inosine/xanthosine triphosphatase n=1 Tax=Glaciecola petra TaxID=3075602 RepID=A0ABU2ZRE3_9ALTE|nr:inosine/xanthosine triphosphatase [Aestuariibacter sp. P117]MDT0595195.1 inosine/xanthosine triphosphatase [Aestuariibacter sp. P117]